MDSQTTVKTLMDSVQKGDFIKAKSLLANNFQFSGPVPQAVNAASWIVMSTDLKTAFPDINYRFKVEGSHGDVVKVSAQMSGTHRGNLNLASLGMGMIPATGKTFAAAHEYGRVTVKGDKIISFAQEPTKGAGIMAILGQLGITPPPMHALS
jgi:hypothetical protein